VTDEALKEIEDFFEPAPRVKTYGRGGQDASGLKGQEGAERFLDSRVLLETETLRFSRRILQNIIDNYPETAAAKIAQERLRSIEKRPEMRKGRFFSISRYNGPCGII